MSLSVRGKHPRGEAGETEAELGKRAELHFKHSGHEGLWEAGNEGKFDAELRVSHMHISMQMPGKRIPSRGDNQYIFLETDMCPVFVTHSNQTV